MTTSPSPTRSVAAAEYDRRMRRLRPDSPARWLCLIGGALLLVRGVGGFAVADSSFGTPGEGWHHLIHIVSGIALLGAYAAGARSARAAALGFGAFYLAVALVGIADGDDVAGLIGADAVDKTFHTVLALVSLGAGLLSRPASGEPALPGHVA